MPLKPSGQTPTSSPPLSIRSASSLQARVAPPLRAMVLTNGSLKTRSAPSGRRKRPVWSWIETIVIRPSTGMVPEWLETTSAPPSVGMFSAPRTSMRNHFSRDRAQRGHEEPLGDLLVEAVLVDGVVAGHPAAQEREEAGQLRLPLLAEHLAGGVLERGQPVARPGMPASGARGRRGRGGAPRLVGGGRLDVRGRLGGHVHGLGRAAASGRSGASGPPGLGGRRRAGRLAPLRTRLAAGGQAARGGRRLLAGAAAGSAAGADRDDLGVTHGRPSGRLGTGGTALGRRAAERTRSVRPPVGGSSAPKSANASAVVYARLEAELGAHPGGVDAAAVGQEADLLGREVGQPGRAQRRADAADRERRQRDGRPLQAADRLGEHQDAVAGDVEGAGDVGERRRAAARRAGPRSCRNCRRGSWPSTVGITGSRKYDVSGLMTCGPMHVGARAAWSPGRRGGGGRSRGRSPRSRRRPWRSRRAARGAAPCPR